MRTIEIILKIFFFIGSAYFLATGNITSSLFLAYLIFTIWLGLVLVFNKKHPSYTYPKKYKYNSRVLMMRQVEGLLLIIFAAVSVFMLQ